MGGIVIGLKTKDEIAGLVKRLGLRPEDFACYTSDNEINALGRHDHENAPVLLTTQRMIIRRTEDRSFAAVWDFHFKGKPRVLRIWDESFTLSEPVSLTLFSLQSLPVKLARNFSDLADKVSSLATEVQAAEPGALILVPKAIGDGLRAVTKAHLEGRATLSADDLIVLDNLRGVAGRHLVVRAVGGSLNRALIGATRPIPQDFAPAIITDASARVQATYKVMERSQGNVVHLPTSSTDYRNVNINLCQRACGKDVLSDPTKSRGIYRLVAEQMEKSEGPWLVISSKAKDGVDVEAALREATGGAVHFDFLHWGRHHGINTYKHVENIMVIGSYFYTTEVYEAIGVAASGLPITAEPSFDTRAIREGEFKHNMLQAILRGNARNSVNGIANACNVFIVASPKNDARRLLQEVLPGAVINDWGKQKQKPLTKHEAAVIAAIDGLFRPGVARVRKKQVSMAVGITPSELGRQLKREAVRSYLKSNDLTLLGQIICRR